MSLTIAVSTSDKYLWCIRPFCYLLNKYWLPNPSVKIFGYKLPDFDIPDNFEFISIAKEQYSKDKWSNGIIEMIDMIDTDHVLLLLEDYWIMSEVDSIAIDTFHDYMHSLDDNFLYLSVCNERINFRNNFYFVDLYEYVLMESHSSSEYQMNFQTHIWNKKLMLENICENEDPWEAEIKGTHRLNLLGAKYRILFPTVSLINYTIAMRNKVKDVVGLKRLSEVDKDYILSSEWIPK